MSFIRNGNEYICDVTGDLILTDKIGKWCQLPYPNHKKGCPNYNKSERCPPKSKKVDEVFDLNKSHWFLLYRFDIGIHAENMKIKHPKWSKKQCRCVLYWQNKIRKKLKEMYIEMKKKEPELIYTDIPEAMGINVIYTIKKNFSIPIDVKPDDIIFKVSLVGYPIKKDRQTKLIVMDNT